MTRPGEPARAPRRAGRFASLVAALALALTGALASACGGSPAADDVAITLASSPAASQPVVRVDGLSGDELAALERAQLSPEAWQALLRVAVADAPPDQPAVAGRFGVHAGAIEFTPTFPFDPGRQYRVRFDRSRLPGSRGGGDVVETTVGLEAPARTPSTRVTHVHPTTDTWPENVLRLYVQFSGPMSRTSAADHVRILDDRGAVVVDPFLPMDLDLWNQDYTRCTIFLDPGRVKTGIKPNEEMGRAFVPGRRYTIEVAASWRDQHGQPLVEPFRQSFTVGPPDLGVVNPEAWTIASPRAGTRDALVVTLNDALDYGLLHRAVGVARSGNAERPIEGLVTVSPGESVWQFVPARPWAPGHYELVVLSILEDVAGNRVGRLFEVDRFDTIDDHSTPDRVTRRFEIR